MNSNINFKELWGKQTSLTPNPDNLISEIKKIKRSNLIKLLWTNLFLISTSVFVILVWVFFKPQFISTKIGLITIVLAIIVFLLAYNKIYVLFVTVRNAQSNNDYLKELLIIKGKQKFLETTLLNLYFTMLSAGVGLYMYEYTCRMKPIWGLITYGVTTIWILVNWFYLRPKQIKVQKEKLDRIIKKFEGLSNQLKV
jgi:hypothetical protein